jgi:chemotaxis protein CheX
MSVAPGTAVPALPTADVWGVVEVVWGSLLGTCPSPVEPLVVGPDWVSAVVTLDGSWRGSVAFSCPPRTADHVARTMLELAAAEPDPDPEDVEDAVREVVNVLGGNVKALLPGGRSLGLPTVVLGPPRVAGELAGALDIGWPGHVARVAVWSVAEDGDAPSTSSLPHQHTHHRGTEQQ